jgi:L-2,4-diaminobutyrate decarboxylase
MSTSPFQKWFLSSSHESLDTYDKLMTKTVNLLKEQWKTTDQPYNGISLELLQEKIKNLVKWYEEGEETAAVLQNLKENLLNHSLFVTHPASVAHLHCPPITPALAAEVIITALNQSMDSWDQSPAATYVEEELIRLLIKEIGYPSEGSGTFTSGGTQSNYMGQLLARNNFCRDCFHIDVSQKGLPSEARKLRIICSEHAHFTVQQSAAQLGLGTDAVIPVQVNDQFQLCPDRVKETLEWCKGEGLIPFMIVATAGTTDFGSIDPLAELAEIARQNDLWMHVDAAYGGALLFSTKHQHLLKGIHQADSITMDFHKLFYQPISCGAFFVKDRSSLQAIRLNAHYLNPEEDEQYGILNLVDRSIQTTKRFDALKLLLTFQLIGKNMFGSMVNSTIETAHKVANYMRELEDIELLNDPQINAIVFRYLPKKQNKDICKQQEYENKINRNIQRVLYEKGLVIMAKTKHNGYTYLKFTILNPLTTFEQVFVHLEEIIQLGKGLEEQEEKMHKYVVV